ncbi:ATP-binding protein [Lysinibacter cavernae]|uniref:SpoVK/Ycf46/Vps4 family AAA+-type ATPase n=1 Tax=Lysinibacter cavernae TaxID=1640652 RepID=A0A7X5R3X7_9MICO|nr:ATP-binding protein [Lysinibacter cavernae]NIH55218.1 SpoVK/Ycf46/Vps4 family AAA+-type ATPase [Lysinibacter cavernae]
MSSMPPASLESLRRAVDALPNDVPLRLLLMRELVAEGHYAEAVQQGSQVLAEDADNSQAMTLMQSALNRMTGATAPTDAPADSGQPANAEQPAPSSETQPSESNFDWDAAANDLGEIAQPRFATTVEPIDPGHGTTSARFDQQQSALRLSDVAGMDDVKARIEASFLAPIRNPEIAKMYGMSMRGGLLIYGPPGCGKTYLGKALAGELDATFISIAISDILDMYMGVSERNLHDLFEEARASTPCVLFIDEVDALGGKRAGSASSSMRSTVNQLLAELDGVQSNNDGIFVVGATNAPWDVDPALRRPGRLDRTVLVTPPDVAAREAMFRSALAAKPIANIDVAALAQATEGFSGADIVHICNTATERALMDSVRTATVRLISMKDLKVALKEVKPSVGPWFETARNVVEFANKSGDYDELAEYLAQRKRHR